MPTGYPLDQVRYLRLDSHPLARAPTHPLLAISCRGKAVPSDATVAGRARARFIRIPIDSRIFPSVHALPSTRRSRIGSIDVQWQSASYALRMSPGGILLIRSIIHSVNSSTIPTGTLSRLLLCFPRRPFGYPSPLEMGDWPFSGNAGLPIPVLEKRSPEILNGFEREGLLRCRGVFRMG
jgi:hypothetical protein